MAYKCRNCGYDEPCAVCVECFQEGDHKGHDYLLIQVAGGCCDCGDPLAWRPEGNCRRHVGNSDADPSELFSDIQRVVARATLRAVVKLLGEQLLRVSRLRSRLTPVAAPIPLRHLIPPPTQPVTNEEVQAIATQVGQAALQCGLVINWLQHVAEFFGDPMRRLLCLAVDDLPPLTGDEGGPVPAPEAATTDKFIIQLLLMDHLLPDPLQEEVRKWYFTLIGDTQYKMIFSICYVKAYPFLIDVYVEEKTKQHRSKYETLLTMSTQFFHPHLIPHLVHNAGLLEMLFDTTHKILLAAFRSRDEEGQQVVSKELDTESAVLRKRLFWILCYDMRAVTAVPTVVQPLVVGSPALLDRFLHLWGLFHNMDPVPRRRLGSHVPVESNSWMHSFTLEIECIEAVTEQVADGVEVLSTAQLADPDALAHARATLRRCLDTLLAASPLRYRMPSGDSTASLAHLTLEAAPDALWTAQYASEPEGDAEQAGKPAGTGHLVALPWAGGRYRVADYDVHRHSGVSFHLPLQRLFTRVLLASALVWRAPLSAFFPDLSRQELVGCALSMLEAPLCIQALTSQVMAGAWVRNGYGLIQAASVYTTQVEAEGMLNADVAALQVAATLLRNGLPPEEADLLVPALLHRFTLSHHFDWASASSTGHDGLEAKHKQTLAEDVLRLMINIINDRTIVGPPLPSTSAEGWREERHALHMRDFLVHTVVHELACGPKSHSQVVKAVGERMLKHRHGYFPHVRIQTLLDQILAQMAEFTPPSGPSHPTGTYTLKASCLPLFDPYYLHYTRQEQQAALEVYHAMAKKLRPSHTTGVGLPGLREVPEVIREGVAGLVYSRTLLAVIFSILHHIRAARLPNQPFRPSDALWTAPSDIGLLHPALTLLKLALQFHAAQPGAPAAQTIGEARSVSSLFEVEFPGEDPAVNMCQEFVLRHQEPPVHESILMLLFHLRGMESEDLAEYRDALTEVIGLVEAHGGPAVQAALEQLRAHLDEEQRAKAEAQQKEELRKRRMEENKARQQAILARFAAKQKAFIETTAKEPGLADADEAEAEVATSVVGGEAGELAVTTAEAAGPDTSEDLACVLCKEGAQPGKGLGYVALVQHSHVLPVAKRQHLGKLYAPEARLLADFLRPASASSSSSSSSSPAEARDKGKLKADEAEDEGAREDEADEVEPHATEATAQTESDASSSSAAAAETTNVAAEGEDAEARKREAEATREKRARARRWRAELQREVEGSGGAFVNSCGHVMHAECRHQYSLSVARDAALGRLTLDPMLTPSALAQGAFRCPLCRSLANGLIPCVGRATSRGEPGTREGDGATNHADDGGAWDRWVDAQAAGHVSGDEDEHRMDVVVGEQAEDESVQEDEEEETARATLHDFATRVYCAQRNVAVETVDLVPAEFEPHLWSMVACMISALELAARPDPAAGGSDAAAAPGATGGGWSSLAKLAGERRGDTLRTLSSTLLTYGRLLRRSDPARLARADRVLREVLGFVVPPPAADSDIADAPEEEEEAKKAFLRGDMFAHYVRRFFLDLLLFPRRRPHQADTAPEQAQHHRHQEEVLLRWARLLYVGRLLQTVVTLAATFTARPPQESEQEEASPAATSTAPLPLAEGEKAALGGLLDAVEAASGGALRVAHASWSPAQWDLFAEEAAHQLLPYARRVLLFLHVCGDGVVRLRAPPADDFQSARHELEALVGSLGIASGGAIFSVGAQGGATGGLAQRWLQQLFASGPSVATPRGLMLVAPDLPFHFHQRSLPHLYQDLIFFRAPAEAICPTCGQVPRQPGLCLFCGRLVCVGSTCCAPQAKPGECNTHALRCAGGEGVYLLARQTITLLLQSQAEHGCLMGSLYLDEHKEEDVGLKRGRPLYLDASRYEQLRVLWLEHQMAPSITRRAPGQNVHWTQL